jgi:hypothetical protein
MAACVRMRAARAAARKFYFLKISGSMPLLKISSLGKCSQNREMVWHFYGKTMIAIISSKQISLDPNFEHRL